MAKRTQNTVTIAKITVAGTIIVAVTSLIGNLILGYWQFLRKPDDATQSTPFPEAASLAIEQIPQRVFSYYGNSENLGGFAKLDIIFDGSGINPHYLLNYTIPSDQEGYAGIAFQFDKGQDVTDYSAIAFNIQFSEGNIPIDFYVKDIGGNGDYVRVVSKGTEATPFRFDLNIFKNVDFNALKDVGFNSDRDFVSGQHIITIFGVSFLK